MEDDAMVGPSGRHSHQRVLNLRPAAWISMLPLCLRSAPTALFARCADHVVRSCVANAKVDQLRKGYF